jgi:ATP-binding cassette subfamily C (CFTR/MRP) protein 1
VHGTFKISPNQKWPAKGDIEMKNIKAAYDQRPNHFVLKNLSLCIKGGEKIGICGRTGCGKSTLVSCLFRLLELKSGCIKIDGIDVSLLDLKTLRQGMQIIPQDPILFTGSIRSNLQRNSSDAELWEALERVGLKDYVSTLPEKLDSPIEASGSNMSYGQRQLVCLARAFLAKPVILVMDEATASIDQESDSRVQSIIKQHFSHATILSIAHRLESIADFDKILVLDAGELIEFDAPSILLSDPTSAFSQLVEAAGPETSEKIRKITF